MEKTYYPNDLVLPGIELGEYGWRIKDQDLLPADCVVRSRGQVFGYDFPSTSDIRWVDGQWKPQPRVVPATQLIGDGWLAGAFPIRELGAGEKWVSIGGAPPYVYWSDGAKAEVDDRTMLGRVDANAAQAVVMLRQIAAKLGVAL